jgi:hypothetical protein
MKNLAKRVGYSQGNLLTKLTEVARLTSDSVKEYLGMKSHFKEMKTYVQAIYKDKNYIHDVKLTSTSLFSLINSTYLSSLYIMMCINFPITMCLLQNNERGFPLIFTITVVECSIFYNITYFHHTSCLSLTPPTHLSQGVMNFTMLVM